MTNVEALLSVESGTVPSGVEVFYEADQESPRYRAWMVLAGVMTVATVFTAVNASGSESGRWEVALMGLFAAFAAVMAIPVREEKRDNRKPRVLVMSDRGLITRDPWGLQNWDYEELARVSTCWLGGKPHLVIEERGGKEHLLDFATFEGSARIATLLKQRVGA